MKIQRDKRVTVQELISSCKTNNTQRSGRNRSRTNSSQVKRLKSVIHEMMSDRKLDILNPLRSISNPIILSKSSGTQDIIIQGNHRIQALREMVEEGTIGLNYECVITHIGEILPPRVESELSYAANNNNADMNWKSQAASGALKATQKLINPIQRALESAGLERYSNKANCYALNLAGVFEKNPEFVTEILENGTMSCTAKDIYGGRTHPVAKRKNLTNYMPTNDLSSAEFREKLGDALRPGIDAIHKLRTSGVWKQALGGQSLFEYYILALSLQGAFTTTRRGGITYDELKRVLLDPPKAKHIKKVMSSGTNGLSRSLSEIEHYFK